MCRRRSAPPSLGAQGTVGRVRGSVGPFSASSVRSLRSPFLCRFDEGPGHGDPAVVRRGLVACVGEGFAVPLKLLQGVLAGDGEAVRSGAGVTVVLRQDRFGDVEVFDPYASTTQ